MNIKTQYKWDKSYQSCTDEFPLAAAVLSQNQHLLPKKGKALDLACGRGANAICLAENGLTVAAWDLSPVALEQLADKAKEKKIIIHSEYRDVTQRPMEPDTFDVIVVNRFLNRGLMGNIRDAIRSNGLIFYQTFIKDKVNKIGPNNPDYLLDKNELLNFFNDWHIIYYREEGNVGKIERGFRDQALLVAQRP